MNHTEDKKTIQEEVDEFLSELDMNDIEAELVQGLTGESSPILQLVALLLNEATKFHALEVVLRADANKCYVSHLISGEWIEAEAPPKYLFPNIRNLYMTMAGLEYWHQGELNGKMDLRVSSFI